MLIIYDEFLSSTLTRDTSFVEESCMSILDTFESLRKQLPKRPSNAFCEVDPISTWLSRFTDKSIYEYS